MYIFSNTAVPPVTTEGCLFLAVVHVFLFNSTQNSPHAPTCFCHMDGKGLSLSLEDKKCAGRGEITRLTAADNNVRSYSLYSKLCTSAPNRRAASIFSFPFP